jgi:uncharacterized protein YbcV (DUF1398 family)
MKPARPAIACCGQIAVAGGRYILVGEPAFSLEFERVGVVLPLQARLDAWRLWVMDATAVQEAALATLAGTMTFPQIVAKLVAAGVEYYHVDYVGRFKRFYDSQGACVVTALALEGLPKVAAELDVPALRDDIRDSQQHGQHYREFTARAMRAGVQGYFAFLRGQRVTYLGRAGDQHIEWFPGAGPGASS